MDTPTTPRPCPLKPGAHLQVYLDVLAGHTHAARMADLDAILAEWAAAGGVGFVVHAYVGALTLALFGELADLAAKHGLQVSCAWGLGETDSHNPRAAAAWIARIAADPRCAATVLDAETKWRNEASDVEAAAALGRELRRLAPAAYYVGQFAAVLQTKDTEYRNMGRREFLAWLDALASMDYRNYSIAPKGEPKRFDPGRYAIFERWRERHATLGADLGVPQTWATLQTLQGYWWTGIVHSLVDCLMTAPGGVSLVWAEPRPDADFLAAMRAVQASGGQQLAALHALAAQGYPIPDVELALVARGYTGPGALKRFQREHGLKDDGVAGPLTRGALGL